MIDERGKKLPSTPFEPTDGDSTSPETEIGCITCEMHPDDGNWETCSKSKRPCGHHCNHSWTHDECCWCGKEFGEENRDQASPEKCPWCGKPKPYWSERMTVRCTHDRRKKKHPLTARKSHERKSIPPNPSG